MVAFTTHSSRIPRGPFWNVVKKTSVLQRYDVDHRVAEDLACIVGHFVWIVKRMVEVPFFGSCRWATGGVWFKGGGRHLVLPQSP